MENETDEQFEERVLNKRAAQMFVAVRSKMQKQDRIYLSEMTYRNYRKQVCMRTILSSYIYSSIYQSFYIQSLIHLFFTGRAEILLVIGIEEIPSIGIEPRRIIW